MTNDAQPGSAEDLREIKTIGLAGCGRMGMAIADHLLDAGWPVVVTDPVQKARAQAVSRGAAEVESASELAQSSDLVLVAVVDDAQVRDLLTGPEGVLASARPGSVVAICASVHPDTCKEMAELAARHDVHVVDVALVGGQRGAEEGSVTLLCGGPDAVLTACTPVFSTFALSICVLGPVGAGQVGKTANNLLLWACLRIDVEALRLARAYGVEPGKLRPVLMVGSGANTPLGAWGRHRLTWPGKDLDVATRMAEDVGLELPLVEQLGPLMDELSIEDLSELR